LNYSKTRVYTIQHALGLTIDGSYGPKTKDAVMKYQKSVGLVADGIAGTQTMSKLTTKIMNREAALLDKAKFFSTIRNLLFKSLTVKQVVAIEVILANISKQPINEQAYMLATTYHETATTMLPIAEYGKGRNYPYGRWVGDKCFTNGRKNKTYSRSEYPHLYYGRGYVQLTWFDNYKLASSKLGIDFLRNPDLVMTTENAAKIMLNGMTYGWFTGRSLSNYISLTDANYKEARCIINGTDKASLIASYAEKFELALRLAKS
jgi:predicted chitinase